MLNQITILISDDHTIVRAALRVLLEATGDIVVVGEAANGQEAVKETKRLRPRVVLMDLAMPLLNGIEAARQITTEVPSTKVLALSAYTDDQHVHQAIEAGVTGYLVKNSSSDDMLRAVREVAQGNSFISPFICERLLSQWRAMLLNQVPGHSDTSSLTLRQAQVLQLVAEGYMNKEIAPMMSVTLKTVEKHRQGVMQKLKLHNVASLTRYAVSNGIIDLGRIPNRAA